MSGDSRFRVIEGGSRPRKYHHRGEPQQWLCTTCERDIGVATSAVVEVKIAPQLHRGRMVGGNKHKACAYCLGRGKMTLAT